MSKEAALSALQATIPAVAGATTTLAGSPGLQPAPSEPTQELESTRFNHLMKKESELQRQRETFKKEQESFAKEREKMQSIQQKLQQFDEMKVKDPVAALKLAGFSETDLFNFIAASEDNSTPEERAAKAAQAEIQKFTDGQAKKEADIQARQEQEVLGTFRKNITEQITSDKDRYEYCNYHGALAEDLIYSTVEAVLKDSEEIISVEEAADMVESYYEEQDKSMSTIKKRQPKPVEQAKVDEPLKAQVSARPPSKTLSSRTSATVASTTITRKETSSEKKERLIQKLLNSGKS